MSPVEQEGLIILNCKGHPWPETLSEHLTAKPIAEIEDHRNR